MDDERIVAVRTQYQARPGRRAIVVLDLADLQGPTEGTVELPISLFWSCPGYTFDVGDLHMRRELYETVLREAASPEELTSWLHHEFLVAIWPDLHLPKGVRRAWDDHHPVLRHASGSAA
jgi:hypothetical protein